MTTGRGSLFVLLSWSEIRCLELPLVGDVRTSPLSVPILVSDLPGSCRDLPIHPRLLWTDPDVDPSDDPNPPPRHVWYPRNPHDPGPHRGPLSGGTPTWVTEGRRCDSEIHTSTKGPTGVRTSLWVDNTVLTTSSSLRPTFHPFPSVPEVRPSTLH